MGFTSCNAQKVIHRVTRKRWKKTWKACNKADLKGTKENSCLLNLEIKVLYFAQKMKFSIEDFFSRCEQVRRKLRIWSHLLKKFSMENFIFFVQC